MFVRGLRACVVPIKRIISRPLEVAPFVQNCQHFQIRLKSHYSNDDDDDDDKTARQLKNGQIPDTFESMRVVYNDAATKEAKWKIYDRQDAFDFAKAMRSSLVVGKHL